MSHGESRPAISAQPPQGNHRDDRLKTIPYDLHDEWQHVLLASPLAHVEPIDSSHVRIFGKGRHNRSGLLWRCRLARHDSQVRVDVLDLEIAASLALYGGRHGWERVIELGVNKTHAWVDMVDDKGATTRIAWADRPPQNGPRNTARDTAPDMPLATQLMISRLDDTFTCYVGDRLIWRGSLPFDLAQARVLLRATGDLHNEGRERSALFGPTMVAGKVEWQSLEGKVVTLANEPVTGAWLHLAGDPFVHAQTDADGRFTLRFPPTDDSAGDVLVVGAEGIGFTTTTIRGLERYRDLTSDRNDDSLIIRLDYEDIPRPEYPRPDFDRSSWWQNLNGVWRFALDLEDQGVDQGWVTCREPYTYVARVPFPWTSLMAVGEESFASNISYTSLFAGMTGCAWYQRTVRIADDFPAAQDLVLKFGAVNYQADVYWNGTHIGSHDGGYTPFECVIGPAERDKEHVLAVRVYYPHAIDPTDIPVGKQGWWFTHAPGIWQSVWLEARSPVAHLTRIHVTPHISFQDGQPEDARFDVTIAAKGTWDTLHLTLQDSQGEIVATDTKSWGQAIQAGQDGVWTVSTSFNVPAPPLWDPESPHLYTIWAELRQGETRLDRVSTYSGLRQVRCDWAPGHDSETQTAPEEQFQYIYLNDQPIYLLGILDQGYNPWGVYSYPAYGPPDVRGSILFDLKATQRHGFKLTRLHIKANEPLWLYAAAKAGLLVWDELPNVRGTPTEENWRAWNDQFDALYERDYNCPAIIIRSLFNESWGVQDMRTNPKTQALIQDAVAIQRAREPHRLVVDNSAAQGYPNRHIDTDINDEHVYIGDWWAWHGRVTDATKMVYPGSDYNFHSGNHEPDEVGEARQSGQPYVMSEFSSDGRKTLALRMHPKVAGFVKINLTDQEWERFSPLTYDRQVKPLTFLDADLRPLGPEMEHSLDAVVIEAPLVNYLPPGGQTNVKVHVASFSRAASSGPISLYFRVVGQTELQDTREINSGVLPVSIPRFTVRPMTDITVQRPADCELVYLFVWLERDGNVCARDYVTWKGGP